MRTEITIYIIEYYLPFFSVRLVFRVRNLIVAIQP